VISAQPAHKPARIFLRFSTLLNDTQNTTVKFPIVADPDSKIARLFEMIHAHESETSAVRSVFIIDPK
jgi:alkyl hydroperoxide reductase subunit AhpC